VAAKKTKGNQGIRYSAEQKADIAQFIEEFNDKHKRGGMKAASDKYGVSVVTLSNWGKSSRRPKKSRAKAKKATKTVIAPVKTESESADAILKRLQAIRGEMAVLQKEFNALKKKL
jgi:transposase-like protein